MVENIFIENIIDFLQFLMLSVKIKVLILEPEIKISCIVVAKSVIYPQLTFSPSGSVSCWAWTAGPSSGSPRTAHHCSQCLGTTGTSLCSWSGDIKCCRHVLIGFIQNHLCCSIVQEIPRCQFTLQMTEISTRFLEIFLGRTCPLLAYIFGKIFM